MPSADQPNWWETRWFAIAAVLLSAVPLLVPTLPPLIDLPGHIGRYHIAANLAGSADLQRHWAYHWALIGNLGVDLIFAPFVPWLGAELAAKIVVVAIPPLTVAGMIMLSREAMGRLSPTAALAFPLAYAWPFQFGFVNFALSAALAMIALAGWIRLGRRQERLVLRFLLFVLVSCALWLAHSFGWAMFGLLAFTADVVRARNTGRPLHKAAIVAALWSLGLALPLAAMLGGGASGPGGLAMEFNPVAKLVWLTSLLRERWKWYDIICALFLYNAIWSALRYRDYRYDRLLGALALVAGALFLALPRLALGGSYVDMRILPYAIALALLAIRTDAAIANRTAILAAGFFIVRTLTSTIAMLSFAGPQQQALAAVSHLSRGAAVLVLVNEPCSSDWHSRRVGHIAGIAIARRDIFENGQWMLPGQQLLGSRHPDAAPFVGDPSQLLYPKHCEAETRTLDEAVGAFDRRAFDLVWTIDFPARRQLAPGVRLQWTNGVSSLYRVDKP